MTLVCRILVGHTIFKDKRQGSGVVYSISSDRFSRPFTFPPVSLLPLPSGPSPTHADPSPSPPRRHFHSVPVSTPGSTPQHFHRELSMNPTGEVLWGKGGVRTQVGLSSPGWQGKKETLLHHELSSLSGRAASEVMIQKVPLSRAGGHESPVEATEVSAPHAQGRCD